MTPSHGHTLHVPPGHPSSPIPSAGDVERAIARAAAAGPTLAGLDLRAAEQLALLTRWLPSYRELADPTGGIPDQPGAGRYYFDNTWFTHADALGYALMLQRLQPKRVIEVGAGFSSALALDIADRYHLGTGFTFVDPDPQRLRTLLRPGDAAEVLAVAVQDVPLARFAELGAGDILFIDSSHVLRAGSDVQFLLDEVLPALAPGVHVHFHDIFWPFEYPAHWLRGGVAFSEAYGLRALLCGSQRLRVVLFNSYLIRFHRDWLAANMPMMLAGRFDCGSIWIAIDREPSQPGGGLRPAATA